MESSSVLPSSSVIMQIFCFHTVQNGRHFVSMVMEHLKIWLVQQKN